VSHPSLGLPPVDMTAGDPTSAAALRRERRRIGERALAFALESDPTFGERHDELALEDLRLDVDSFVNRLADAVASNQPGRISRWAENVVPRFRKKGVSMDDLTLLFEGLRRAAPAAVLPDGMPIVDASVNAVIAVFRWHRRLAGDPRPRNPILDFIYKGA
jgi:hypothetical protein